MPIQDIKIILQKTVGEYQKTGGEYQKTMVYFRKQHRYGNKINCKIKEPLSKRVVKTYKSLKKCMKMNGRDRQISKDHTSLQRTLSKRDL